MDRNALGSALVAVLAVVAFGVGAASLDALDSQREAGSGGSFSGVGSGGGFVPAEPEPIEVGATPTLPSWLLGLLVVAVVAAFALALYRFRDEFSLETLRKAALAAVPIGVVVLFVYLVLQLFGSDNIPERNGSVPDRTPMAPGGSGGGSAMEGTSNAPLTDPPLLAITGLAGLVLLVGVAAVWFGRDGGESDPEMDQPSADEPAGSESTVGIGNAAGRAADRIDERGEAGNEIYRAWEEMTDHLDVANPGSSTPREFARAAADAGMERGDVDELTDLFRTVRYGGRRVTDDRESRAVNALRNIEREYAEEP